MTFGSPSATLDVGDLHTTGTYVLTLTANDGEFAISDPVTVTVSGVINVAPR